MRLHKYLVFIPGIILFEFLLTGCVVAQHVSYNGSMQYATGSYFFTETTRSFYLNNGIMVSGNRGSVGFNIPYVIQNTPWISYSGGGYLPTGGPQSGSVGGKGSGQMGKMGRKIVIPDTVSYAEASFSDPTVNAGLKLLSGKNLLFLNASVKVPFSNPDNGFGTGNWDFGAGVSYNFNLTTFFLSADVMYWWFGDMEDLVLKNAFSYTAGVGKFLSQNKWMALATVSGYTNIIEGEDPPLNLNAGLGYFISSRASVNGTISIGLTDTSSDLIAGLGWSFEL